MRFLKEIYAKHKNQSLWIAGSDPTLESYPDDFLKDKTALTLHMAHVKFPDATYRYANESDRVMFLARKYPDYLTKDNIFGYPFYWKSRSFSRKIIREGKPWLHYLRSYQPWGIRGLIDWKFTLWKVRRVAEGKTQIFGGHGTCLHGALYTAIYLGASEINLIGCGHGLVGQGNHFAAVDTIDQGMRPDAPKKSDPVKNIPMIEQTLAIMDGCAALGIKVNWIREWTPDLSERITINREDFFRSKKDVKKPPLTARKAVRYLLMPLVRLINCF